jgi:thioredoxin-related protein
MYSSISLAETKTSTHPEPFGIPDWFKNSFLDLSEDNAEAQDEGKHLLVLFTQDFCPYCKALIEKNLTQKKIRDSLDANFDIVHLNMWGDREVFDIHGEPTTEKAIAETLKVQFTPTLIFFDKRSNRITDEWLSLVYRNVGVIGVCLNKRVSKTTYP